MPDLSRAAAQVQRQLAATSQIAAPETTEQEVPTFGLDVSDRRKTDL
jgi:hypothetical protein